MQAAGWHTAPWRFRKATTTPNVGSDVVCCSSQLEYSVSARNDYHMSVVHWSHCPRRVVCSLLARLAYGRRPIPNASRDASWTKIASGSVADSADLTLGSGVTAASGGRRMLGGGFPRSQSTRSSRATTTTSSRATNTRSTPP
eukprot:scaffold527251_cov41-Prasinocladus_malaysianus.AAC.1